MQADGLAGYDLWDLAMPHMSPRSILYPLGPVGVGTRKVECATTYLARLARAHRTHVGTLLTQVILPRIERSYRPADARLGKMEWSYQSTRINGVTDMASSIVSILSDLTLRPDLRRLTLLPWRHVFPPRGLLRKIHAWCRYCYGTWRALGQVVYDPLIWSLAIVTACPHHAARLQTVCPYDDCGKEHYPLESN